MAIAFRASTSTTPTSGTSTITIPGTVEAGDWMLIAGGLNQGNDTSKDWPTPSGWTRLDAHDTGNLFAALYIRQATAGDQGATVTLPTSALGKSGVAFASWSGTHPTGAVEDWDVRVENASATAHATPNVDTADTDRLIILVGVQSNSVAESWATASGYTTRRDAIDNTNLTGHVTVTIQDKAAPTVGTYGGENLTAAGTSSKAVTWTIALKPVSTTQTVRPTSDVSSSNAVGVPTPGAGEGIYTRLAANSDAAYAEIQNGGYSEVKFAALTDPNSGSGHTIRYRLMYAGGATSGTMLVEVREGATVRASWTDTLGASFAPVSHTLTSGEANAISDYTNLRVRFTPTVS